MTFVKDACCHRLPPSSSYIFLTAAFISFFLLFPVSLMLLFPSHLFKKPRWCYIYIYVSISSTYMLQFTSRCICLFSTSIFSPWSIPALISLCSFPFVNPHKNRHFECLQFDFCIFTVCLTHFALDFNPTRAPTQPGNIPCPWKCSL